MATLQVTYDGYQHCTALKASTGAKAAMDCPYTGKGEELSPGMMVGSGLAGCMLISMGMLATRDDIDITGTTVDIDFELSERRLESISLVFNMPKPYSEKDRTKLERAAGLCPIKSSFHPELAIDVDYLYPD